MATKNFTQFDLRTSENLTPDDFVVGYKADGSAELRTTVRNLTAALGNTLIGPIGSTGATGPAGATGYDFNYTPLTTNLNLETNTGYIVNTTINGVLTGTLPAIPSVGHFVNFTITTNGNPPFVIARNNENINSLAEDLTCDVTSNFTLVYTDATTGWKFIPFAGITTPSLKTYKAILSADGNNQTGIPGVSGLQNIRNDERIPYNLEVFNTDPATFGSIQNPGSVSSVSFLIKTPGYYNISSNLHILDLQEGRHVYVQLWEYTASGGDRLLQAISDYVAATIVLNDHFIYGETTIYVPQPDTFLYLKLSHNVPEPGPYPSLSDTRLANLDIGTKGPSEITITKLG